MPDTPSSPNDPSRSEDLTASLTPGTAPTEGPAGGSSAGQADQRAALPTQIGGYAITRILGQGGMGLVYEARQQQPERVVALKVVRAGYLSAEMLRRFILESQVLGRLQHPGIAQVYEAGTAKDDRGSEVPFFAMEFIRGIPLTQYADTHKLGTRQRLEMVARICDAVNHAHQKGVIHRDLKPGNILVDESGQPKILDFGVARATDSDIQHTTMQTDIGQLVGTVPYMSPEQVSGDPDDLDTRSDVYALGVITYELLAGRLPYDLRKKMIHEAVRVIREEAPTRLSSIHKTLRGDVETIVAKALEKDKARRYPSADSLGSDIRRYLTNETITARPASGWYQLSRFAKRNRVLVAGVAATLLALVGGVVASTLFALNANAERRNTEQALAFQSRMLSGIVPYEMGRGVVDDLRERIDRKNRDALPAFESAVATINYSDLARGLIQDNILSRADATLTDRYADRPSLEASLRMSLGEVYAQLNMNTEARGQFERAADLFALINGAGSVERAEALNYAALVAFWDTELQDASEIIDRIVAARGNEIDPRDPVTIETAVLRAFLDTQLDPRDTTVERSLALLHEAHALTTADPDIPLRARAITTLELGRAYIILNRIDDALPLLTTGLELADEAFGPTHVYPLLSRGDLVQVLLADGRYEEAQPHAERSLERQRRALGNESRLTQTGMDNLARVLNRLGNNDVAESLYRESIEQGERLHGELDDDVLISRANLAKLIGEQGDHESARDMYAETLARARRSFNFSSVGMSSQGLGWTRMRLGEHDAAEDDLLRSFQVLSTIGFVGQHHVHVSAQMLVDLYEATGQHDQAEEWKSKLPEDWDPPDR